MAISSAIGIILGFVPHILIAKRIGLGFATDAYLMAISLNQIIVKFFRIGTLPKIFIMVLSDDFVTSRKKTESNLNNFVNLLILLSLLASVLIYFASPLLVNLIAKGFDADKKIFTIGVLRMLIPLFLYQCLISLFEGIFKLYNKFSSWAILNVIPVLIITISVSLYTSKIGIYSIVYGALLGSFIHLLALIYFIYFKFRYSYRFKLDFKHELFPKTIKLLFPYYFSSVPVQIMLGVQSLLVSLLPTGFASVFFYAQRIIDHVEQFSINIFSQLMLPYFAKKMIQASLEHIRKIYTQLVCITNFVHLPILIILTILGRQIIDIFFSSRFTSPEILSTLGITFSLFMLFFLLEPSNDVQFNIILAMKRTLWVNLVNISCMAVVITLSILLFRYFKFWGIIFSYSLTNLQAFLINQWHLRKRYAFENILINQRFIKIILLNILLTFFCLYLNYSIHHNFQIKYLYQKVIATGMVFSIGILFYGFTSYLFRSQELNILFGLLKKDDRIK